MPEPTLVVLRCADLDRSRAFYEALGFGFVRERHGSGPEHLAAVTRSGLVVELYPATGGTEVGRGTVGDVRLGFDVDSLNDVVTALADAGFLDAPPPDGTVVVTDPDGRRIQLSGARVTRP